MHWHDSDDRSETEQRVAKEIAKRQARGEPMVPLVCAVARGTPCATFWGKAWCDNLEAYSDYGNRLAGGRTYLRGGKVMDLDVMEGEIFAYVAGTELYEVSIFIEPLERERWQGLKAALAGKISNLVDLLGGKMGDGVLRAITDPEDGLFPEPKRIRFDCSCPDYADMCKHVAAVLYGVGVKLDSAPELFFKLRKVDHRELIGAAGERAGDLAGEISAAPSDQVLAAEDLSQLFGIELAEPEAAFGAAICAPAPNAGSNTAHNDSSVE